MGSGKRLEVTLAKNPHDKQEYSGDEDARFGFNFSHKPNPNKIIQKLNCVILIPRPANKNLVAFGNELLPARTHRTFSYPHPLGDLSLSGHVYGLFGTGL